MLRALNLILLSLAVLAVSQDLNLAAVKQAFDAASAQIRHFLGPNFFAECVTEGHVHDLVNRTAAISEFLQPTPPAGSDAHRYIFLLFNQPTGFNAQTLVTPTTPITLFNISAFAEATGLGNPIAGTFMLVAPDPTET
ncbi:hypothetical protein C0992_012661 [Termitomyces sp. T32_za158]|nr:hypothetical protein C0992_012661 [Termitomyces sp. T32_za158]